MLQDKAILQYSFGLQLLHNQGSSFSIILEHLPDYFIEHFEKYHHNGAIVLMHNVSSSNAEALETVIKMLKEEGYRFESLNNMEF